MKNLLLLILLLLALGNFLGAQTLYVNEFLASNDSCIADEYGEYDDWIEIYNPGNTPVDIGGMYITDDLTDPTKWQIPTTAPDTTTVPPGGFLLLWADKQPGQGVLHVNIKLSSGGEQIGLFAPDGSTPIDTLTFGAQTTDISSGRLPDGSNNWVTFTNPNPRYTNRTIPVIVNEFLASNDTYAPDPYGEFDDWIELFNAGTSPVDVGGFYITDDLTDPTTWQIPATAPDSTTIQPGEYLVLWADKQPGQGVLHVNIKLSGDGEQIGLFAPDGTTPVDTLTFGPQESDTSYGRVTDGINTWAFFSAPTIGAANSGGVIVGIHHPVAPVADGYALRQNYPNPFNPSTTIEYLLPQKSRVEIAVYNVVGEWITTLVNDVRPAGDYRVRWDGRNREGNPVGGGLYFYVMKAGDFRASGKMLLIK